MLHSMEHAQSWYAASAIGMKDYPVLDEVIDADVCVIGGGMTGNSTALHLAEKGYSVALLEARRISWGASGRSGGQIIAGYSCEMEVLEKMLGKEDARQLWQVSEDAVSLLRRRVRDHRIDCDLTDGFVLAGVKKHHRQELQQWCATLNQRYQYSSIRYVGPEEIRDMVSSDRYTCGCYDTNSGHLHPLSYTLGLARAAHEAGARIYERSEVTGIGKSENGHRVVQTVSGSVRCRYVVYCCNAYIDRLHPSLRHRIMPVGTYIIATEPLGRERAEALIPNNAAISDNAFVLDYFRRSRDHRLLFGGKVSYSTMPPPGLANAMRRQMVRVFPQLSDVKVDYVWGGNVAITINRAPDIGQTEDDVFYAQGFSGHGVALTGFAGKVLADAVAGTAEKLDLFSRIRHKPFPGGPLLRTPSLVLAMTYYRLRDML